MKWWRWKVSLLGLLVCCLALSTPLAVLSRAQASSERISLASNRPGCLETSLMAMRRLPHLFIAGEVDSVTTILARWQAECGPLEPIMRSQLLAAVWSGTFCEEDVDSMIFTILLASSSSDFAQGEQNGAKEGSPWFVYTHDLHHQQQSYNAFTRWLAARLVPTVAAGSSARVICLLYAGSDDLISQLRAKEFADSRLYQIYVDQALQARQRLHTAWAVYAGGASNWRRDGGRSAQPLVGFRYGVQVRRTWLRASLELGGMTVKAPELSITLPAYSVPADSVSGWHRTDSEIAVELGRILVDSWRHSLEWGLGLSHGYRTYNPVNDPDEDIHQAENIEIRNGQAYLLLGYGYHFGRLGGSALQLEIKYGWGRFEEYHPPRWLGDDWSVRLAFVKHQLKLPGS